MLLQCELVTVNRLTPSLESRRTFSTFCLTKKTNKCGEEIVSFTVLTAKSKTGIKYAVRGNVLRVLSKFIDEGKVTLGMREPPHDLHLSKGDPSNLKKFLHIIKLAYKGETTSTLLQEVEASTCLKNTNLLKPKTSLNILCRSEYPVKAVFPETLEKLSINKCCLKRFDERILRLRHLVCLNLSENQLDGLPGDISPLQSLKVLVLSQNRFKLVPACLMKGQISLQLKLLDLSGNQIRHLPNQFSNLKKLETAKLDRNRIEFLNSNIGLMKTLRTLNLAENRIQILPWSFSQLQLDLVDLSSNPLHHEHSMSLSAEMLHDVPTLFELTARVVLRDRMSFSSDGVPAFIAQQLENAKMCPCGRYCLTSYVPYERTFDVSLVAASVVFADSAVEGKRNMAKMIGYLCSRKCYKKWLENPRALWK